MAENNDPAWLETTNDTSSRRTYLDELAKVFDQDSRSTRHKLDHFPSMVPTTAVGRLLGRYELFKLIKYIPGAIIEAGVFSGGGLFSFAHSSFLLEPHNIYRRIIGFDTFEGFPSISEQDASGESVHLKEGGYKDDCYESLRLSAQAHEDFRMLKGRRQIELIKGDIDVTVPQFIDDNPALVVAMLYLDCDLYEPTKTCLKHFLPRMPKGSLLVFDELGLEEYPGETLALLSECGIEHLHLRKLDFLKMCYAIL